MLESHTVEGYECRVESMYKIADELGINYERGEPNTKLDKIYRDLAPVFQGVDTLPIGTGKTGRLRQASYNKLYAFAKKQYDVEVLVWKYPNQSNKADEKVNKDQETMDLIASFLNKLDQGTMKPEEFIGSVRGIAALHQLKQRR